MRRKAGNGIPKVSPEQLSEEAHILVPQALIQAKNPPVFGNEERGAPAASDGDEPHKDRGHWVTRYKPGNEEDNGDGDKHRRHENRKPFS